MMTTEPLADACMSEGFQQSRRLYRLGVDLRCVHYHTSFQDTKNERTSFSGWIYEMQYTFV